MQLVGVGDAVNVRYTTDFEILIKKKNIKYIINLVYLRYGKVHIARVVIGKRLSQIHPEITLFCSDL